MGLNVVYLLIITRNKGISRAAADIYKMISQIISHFTPDLQRIQKETFVKKLGLKIHIFSVKENVLTRELKS